MSHEGVDETELFSVAPTKSLVSKVKDEAEFSHGYDQPVSVEYGNSQTGGVWIWKNEVGKLGLLF